MKRLHLYSCSRCDLDFGISEDFENQSEIKCPSCILDDRIEDYLRMVPYQTTKVKEGAFSLYSIFEREFGRALSPMEIENIRSWIEDDNHSEKLIILALKQALMSNVRNFRYIDRVLLNWRNNGISTTEAAIEFSQNYRKHQNSNSTAKRQQSSRQQSPSNGGEEYRRKIPLYNWLEE